MWPWIFTQMMDCYHVAKEDVREWRAAELWERGVPSSGSGLQDVVSKYQGSPSLRSWFVVVKEIVSRFRLCRWRRKLVGECTRKEGKGRKLRRKTFQEALSCSQGRNSCWHRWSVEMKFLPGSFLLKVWRECISQGKNNLTGTPAEGFSLAHGVKAKGFS